MTGAAEADRTDPAATPGKHVLSRAIARRAEEVFPGGVNSGTRGNGAPYAFAQGRGAYLRDFDGNNYLDYHAAFGAMVVGHRAPEIDDAVVASLSSVDLTGYGVSEMEVRLGELITTVIPSVEQTIIVGSGSEAVSYAIRLARAATGRKYIVKFQGTFHGWSDSVARNVISPEDRAYGDDPITAGLLPESWQSTLIAEFNDLAAVGNLFEKYPEQIAAVILEPIPHNIGAVLPTPAFLEGLRGVTQEHGSLLIFDEVITGFRHALGGYQEICGIRPDLTTFGKAMGNGYPVAGLGGRRELMRRFDARSGDVALLGTFNANPVSSAAALATINYLREHPDFYTRTYALGDQVRTGLRQIISDRGIAAEVSGYGGTFCTYFLRGQVHGYRELLANDGAASVAFHRGMINRGFLMLPIALKRNYISAAHTVADIDRTLQAADDVLGELVDEGRVPRR